MSRGDLYNASPQKALSPRAFKNHKKFEIKNKKKTDQLYTTGWSPSNT